MSFIARQPNGLLCRFSTIVDCVTEFNMTEEDYVEYCAERAREEARYNLSQKSFVQPYQLVLDEIRFDNITEEEFAEIRRQMETEVEKCEQ